MGAAIGYPIVCVGIPKTIDNDLPITDCCPGFGSVAKYVATSIREAAFDLASMSCTSTKVFASGSHGPACWLDDGSLCVSQPNRKEMLHTSCCCLKSHSTRPGF